MTFENILLEKKNSIAYVSVNRPKVLNALNMATMEELRVAFTDIKDDAAIRVAILTGSGEKAQCPIVAERLREFATDAEIPSDQKNTTIDQHFVPMARVG